LREKSCIDDRNPGKAVFFSDAKKKSGKICILSKLHFLNEKILIGLEILVKMP